MKLGFLRSFGASLASLVDLRSHWRRECVSGPSRQRNASVRRNGGEKPAPEAVICELSPPTAVDLEAARWTLSADNRNLYDSYEVMPDDYETERPLRPTSAYC